MKSPFWGATKYQVGEYKKYAKVLDRWRQDMERGDYRQPPMFAEDANAYKQNWQGMALHRFILRAFDRLRRRDDWNDMADWFSEDKLRRENPAAYKALQLAKEFEEYKKKCNCCHHPH
jgi:hypothetical protein